MRSVELKFQHGDRSHDALFNESSSPKCSYRVVNSPFPEELRWDIKYCSIVTNVDVIRVFLVLWE